MSRLRVAALVVFALLSACKESKPTALTPAQIERVTKVQRTFADVDSTPLSKWIEKLNRDTHPDRELEIFEGMAEAYAAYTSGRTLSVAAKSEVYAVVLLRSVSPDEEVLRQVTLEELSLDDAKEILRLYKKPPVPLSTP